MPSSVAAIVRFSVKLKSVCVPFQFDMDVNVRLDLAIQLIRRDGLFVPAELQPLNPANLK